jgi:uncharacterized membrane-anchored protein YhcB (DUF1043 family)
MSSWKLPAALLTLVVGLSVGLIATQPASAEKQPKMRQALHHLQAAKMSLTHAEADKGGHRAKALELIEQAISEVNQGMAYDNKH